MGHEEEGGLPDSQEPRAENPRRTGIPPWQVAAALLALALVLTAGWNLSRKWSASQRLARLTADASSVYLAIARFEDDHGAPPAPGAGRESGLNLRTLAPLSTGGYLPEAPAILARLHDGRVTAYDARDDRSGGFWMVLTDVEDPRMQVLAARTDAFPLATETWIEGLFTWEGDALRKLAPPPDAATANRRREARR